MNCSHFFIHLQNGETEGVGNLCRWEQGLQTFVHVGQEVRHVARTELFKLVPLLHVERRLLSPVGNSYSEIVFKNIHFLAINLLLRIRHINKLMPEL